MAIVCSQDSDTEGGSDAVGPGILPASVYRAATKDAMIDSQDGNAIANEGIRVY